MQSKKLAINADVMIIIGGKNSSNTKQLHSISEEYCKNSYHIEDKNDLEFSWFTNKTLCGISAGASTPDWIISAVIEAIKEKNF
jgi:4-hydroxy-3-methylbut-2-enyl diphosphate reductase